jgi:hypothetical protein
MNAPEILYVAHYAPSGVRWMGPEETEVRETAWDLKIPTAEAIGTAAPLMARLIDGAPCWLVPVPSSSGSVEANLALARAVGRLVRGARVVAGIRRVRPVESSCARRRRGLAGLPVDGHGFVRCVGPLHRMPVWFVDNVATTGTTIKAAHLAFGTGRGLVYADASSHRTARDP